MSKRLNVYKCATGNLTLEVLTEAGECPEISCCGSKMKLLEEKTADSKVEKHVPLLEGDSKGVKVKVGSVAHPMTEEHYIMWIEVVNGDYVNRKYLHPGDAPEAAFYVPMQEGLQVRSYCNLHGLWKG